MPKLLKFVNQMRPSGEWTSGVTWSPGMSELLGWNHSCEPVSASTRNSPSVLPTQATPPGAAITVVNTSLTGFSSGKSAFSREKRMLPSVRTTSKFAQAQTVPGRSGSAHDVRAPAGDVHVVESLAVAVAEAVVVADRPEPAERVLDQAVRTRSGLERDVRLAVPLADAVEHRVEGDPPVDAR